MSSDIQSGGAVRGDSVEYIRYADSSKPGKAPLSFRGRVAIRFDRQEIANEWGSRDKFRLSASRERPRSMKARRRIERSNRQKFHATQDIASMPPLSLSNPLRSPRLFTPRLENRSTSDRSFSPNASPIRWSAPAIGSCGLISTPSGISVIETRSLFLTSH